MNLIFFFKKLGKLFLLELMKNLLFHGGAAKSRPVYIFEIKNASTHQGAGDRRCERASNLVVRAPE
jgi:hypothetical protein